MTSRIIGRGIAALPIAWEDRPPTVTGLCRAPEVPRPHPRRAVGKNAPSRPRKLRTLRAFGRPDGAAVDGEALYGTTWARAPSPTPGLRLLCPRHGTAVAVPSCHCPGRLPSVQTGMLHRRAALTRAMCYVNHVSPNALPGWTASRAFPPPRERPARFSNARRTRAPAPIVKAYKALAAWRVQECSGLFTVNTCRWW